MVFVSKNFKIFVGYFDFLIHKEFFVFDFLICLLHLDMSLSQGIPFVSLSLNLQRGRSIAIYGNILHIIFPCFMEKS